MDEIRSVPFEVTRTAEEGDGLTLEGYAAVFDSPTEINSRNEGHFIERIKPGAFKRTLSHRMPVLMFDHGQHPVIGPMPLGKIVEAREDARGLFIQARLASNHMVEPIRELISMGAIEGMSFRFSVPKGGEVWRRSVGKTAERDVTQLNCLECGPVVFPAYGETSVGVRSQLREVLADPEQCSELFRALFALGFDQPDEPEERADEPAEEVSVTEPEPAEVGTSDSPDDDDDPPREQHSSDPDMREVRRQARLLVARHIGVLTDE